MGLLFCYVAGYGQPYNDARQIKPTEVVLGEPDVSRQGTEFAIQYSITLGEEVQSCTVLLFLSVDGGKRFYQQPLTTGVSGDVETINHSGNKTIVYKVPDNEVPKLLGKQLVFKVEVTEKKLKKEVSAQEVRVTQPVEKAPAPKTEAFRTFISGLVQSSHPVRFGAMGGVAKKMGLYVKGCSDFRFPTHNSGKVKMNSDVWLGDVSTSSFSGGILGRVSDNLYLLAGAGYSASTQWGKLASSGDFVKLSDRDFVKVSDLSSSGAVAEVGLAFAFGHFFLSASVGAIILLSDFRGDLGIGICF